MGAPPSQVQGLFDFFQAAAGRVAKDAAGEGHAQCAGKAQVQGAYMGEVDEFTVGNADKPLPLQGFFQFI